jgi:deoxyribodipyrimidine photo-lyase
VAWTEWPQTGVVRRLKDRRGWAGRWQQRMDAPCIETPAGFRAAPGFAPSALPSALPSLRDLGLGAAVWSEPDCQPVDNDGDLGSSPRPMAGPSAAGQAVGQAVGQAAGERVGESAGERAGQALLRSFLRERAMGYRRHLSSPLTAETGCSRLSAHLAFGTLSMRTVHQATEAAIATAAHPTLAHDLRGFAGRLRWHCHFMQKLEDEPGIEFRNFARSADGLRPGDTDGEPMSPLDQARLQAWCEGRTGYPMVDACMRQLVATGWLNFRMRAMLVSFAAYHLWLHWRAPGLFLARQFLDFEAGIHWSQMQMQSGTTGINTLRIYSPAKQALDHDPEGLYVRRWVPEFGTAAYPAPIVDERSALARARERLYGLRQTAQAQDEADAIQQRHGSRRSGLLPTRRPGLSRSTRDEPPRHQGDDPQGQLF